MKHVIIVAALAGWIAGAMGGLLAGIAIVVTAQTRAIVSTAGPLPDLTGGFPWLASVYPTSVVPTIGE
jgi:hypothetical protein